MKFYLTVALLASATTLAAQENAEQVLEKYMQAIGGRNNIARVQHIYAFAHCNGPNGAYQTEVQSAHGSKTLFKQVRANKPDYIGMVNGDTNWTMVPEPAIANKQTAFAWRSHELQWIATHLTERFRNLVFAGYEDFAGKRAIKLSGIDELNKTAHLYFDTNTYLLAGFTIFDPFGEQQETIQLTIQEWKKTGRLLMPKKVVFTDKKGSFELYFRTIKVNQAAAGTFDVPARVTAITELLQLHDVQRRAHFSRDARLLVSIIANDYMEVSKGKIVKPGKEQLLKRFQQYFDSVSFIEWDDIEPPVIRVSDDATMASMLVNKRVRLTTQNGKEEITVFAWSASFRKEKEQWRLTSIASTSSE